MICLLYYRNFVKSFASATERFRISAEEIDGLPLTYIALS
jgi:hypothetical protein